MRTICLSAVLAALVFSVSPITFAQGGSCGSIPVPSGVTSCYYFSKSSGSDSNLGNSESSPQQHLPGMPDYQGNIMPTAGEGLILEGCDVWINSDLPVKWTWSGSSSNPIYIGVDRAWYNAANCPSAWNRPIFDAGGSTITGSEDYAWIERDLPTSYTIIDNLEIRNLYWSGTAAMGAVDLLGSDYTTLNHLFIHKWTHASGASDTNVIIVWGYNNPPYNTNSVFENGIVENEDGDTNTGYAFYTWSNLENSVIHDVVTAIIPNRGANPEIISGNLIYNINADSTPGDVHCNAVETVGGVLDFIHDNVIHDVSCPGGESLMIGNSGETDYVWNNVVYNISAAQPPSFPQSMGMANMSEYFWNNTVVTGSLDNCFQWVPGFGGDFSKVTIQNNFCITTGSLFTTGFSVASLAVGNNILQTPTTAASQGYSAGSTYAYQPTNAGGSTVGAGTSLTSFCSGNISGLCNDTSYAVVYNSPAESVSVPGRNTNSRPSSGAWDVGAYQFGSSAVQPPTGLQATAH